MSITAQPWHQDAEIDSSTGLPSAWARVKASGPHSSQATVGGVGKVMLRSQTTIIIAMIALRYVYVVALAIWVGGLITIGSVVAPSAFAVLEAASARITRRWPPRWSARCCDDSTWWATPPAPCCCPRCS